MHIYSLIKYPMRICKPLLFILFLVSCAQSGVISVGPDIYMIANSQWGFASGGYQKAKAMQEANEYCKTIGKNSATLLSSRQNDLEFGKTPAAEIQFKCS